MKTSISYNINLFGDDFVGSKPLSFGDINSGGGFNMKILILNYEFPPLGGGASPVSYEIAKGYTKLGHN